SRIVLRAAIPNRATNPTIAPSDSVAPVSATASTPPISVLGSAASTNNTWPLRPNASASSSTMSTNAAPACHRSSRAAAACAAAAAQAEIADLIRRRAGRGEAHDHRHAAFGLIEVRHSRAVGGGVQGAEYLRGLQSVEAESLRTQLHLELGLTRRHLQTHRAALRQLAQQRGNLAGHLVVDVQIGSEDADRKRSHIPGQRLADALREHRIDLDQLIRELREDLSHPGLELPGRGAARRLELNLELALVRRIRILAVLRAADLLRHALDAGNRGQACGDPFPDPRSLEQRDPGAERGMRDQVVLAEIRQQPGAEDRQQRESGNPA